VVLQAFQEVFGLVLAEAGVVEARCAGNGGTCDGAS